MLIIALSSMASDRPRDVKICDLRRLASQLEGKIVRIQGSLRNSNTHEDPYFNELVGEDCRVAEGGQITIRIISPDGHFLANPPHGYHPDLDSVRRAESVLKKAIAEHRSVSATVEGAFYAERQISGFTPHKQYPANIVIQRLRDVKLR